MLRTLHVAAFALAASGCFAALWRVRRVPHEGIRLGLAGLVGAALLAEEFDGRAIAVVMAACALRW